MLREGQNSPGFEQEVEEILNLKGFESPYDVELSHSRTEEVNPYDLALYCGRTDTEGTRELMSLMEFGENDLLTSVVTTSEEPTKIWCTHLIEDIMLLRYQNLIDMERLDDRRFHYSRAKLSELTTEELLALRAGEELRIATNNWREDPKASDIYEWLAWSEDDRFYDRPPVRVVDITEMVSAGSAYAPYGKTYAIIWRLTDYHEYRRAYLPVYDSVEVEENEFKLGYREVDPTFEDSVLFISMVRMAQNAREDFLDKGVWFEEISLEEMQRMSLEELLALVTYYEYAIGTRDGEKESSDLWAKIDHSNGNPIRVVEINPNDLGVEDDRVPIDEGLPPIYKRTFAIVAKGKEN